jgi:hypothetical protein
MAGELLALRRERDAALALAAAAERAAGWASNPATQQYDRAEAAPPRQHAQGPGQVLKAAPEPDYTTPPYREGPQGQGPQQQVPTIAGPAAGALDALDVAMGSGLEVYRPPGGGGGGGGGGGVSVRPCRLQLPTAVSADQ